METNEHFIPSSPVAAGPADVWQSTWAEPTRTAPARARGTWAGALLHFGLGVVTGLGADAMLIPLAGRLDGGLLLLPVALAFALLVAVSRTMPSRHAAGCVIGFVAGVVSPAAVFFYLLLTTPWGF